MSEDFIPDSQFKPDAAPSPSAGRAPTADEPNSFIPDSEFVSDEEKYGTPGQELLAGVEGAARGVSLGASDFLTPLYSTPEAARARANVNPIPSGIGNVLGSGALLVGTGGLAAPAEAAVGATSLAGQVGARTLGYAAEGAVMGAGNAVSDYALGDPDLNAQKVIAHIGLGAALGGGLGALSKGIEAAPAILRSGRVAEDSLPSMPVIGGGPAAEEAGPVLVDVPMKGVQPTSFEDMAKKVEEATKYGGESLELPQKGVLEDSLSRVELVHAVHPLQMESLENQEARNLYNVARDLPGQEGEAVRGWEALQKRELAKKTDTAIQDLSPGVDPTADAVKGGERAIKKFTDQYKAEKGRLGPMFEALKNSEIGEQINHLPRVIDKLSDKVPAVARMFDTEAEDFAIKPFSPSWGLDKEAYTAVKDLVSAMKESNPETIEEIMNLRRSILPPGKLPDSDQLRPLQASMMDYMNEMLENGNHSIEARQIYRDWAINEQERQVIEKAFGASVGSPEFGAISKIKPEMIGDKIFSNTATVKAAKAILDPKDFKQILANWLSEAKAKATDNGAFSSNKFMSFLRKNQDALNEAFIDNPAGLQKLHDLATIMRILPDAASINPSGTAKTIIGRLGKADSLYGLFKEAGHFAKEKFEESQVRSEVNAALAGKADKAAKLKSVDGIVKRVEKQIETGAKEALTKPATRSAAAVGASLITDEEFKKQTDRIKKLSRDPHAMLEHMSTSSDALYAAAPNITQGIHSAMVAGVQFLASKIPTPSEELPLSHDWEPSKSQRFKFEAYYRAVNEPLSILKDLKNDAVSGESIEALTAVAPGLLQEMRAQVMGHMKIEEAKKLPYASKLMLSKFLGQPLDLSMLPAAILSNQAAMNAPSMSAQNTAQSGRKTGQGGMKQMNLAAAAQTRTQREESDSA